MAVQRRMKIVDDNENSADSSMCIRVAFASNDMKNVNQHFGSTKGLVIYGINPDSSFLIEIAEFSVNHYEENEDKLIDKINVLKGCVGVYSQAVGSSAAKKLLIEGIQPIKVHEETCINVLIKYLQKELSQGPSAWLARAISHQNKYSIYYTENMGAESWED